MRFWKKKVLSDDYVDLSIGRVGFKVLTNGMVNKINSKSTISGNLINNNLFFQLWDYSLVDLSRKRVDGLSKVDGDKIRDKVKEILIRHGLLTVVDDKKEEVFSESDKEWFMRNDPFKNGRVK